MDRGRLDGKFGTVEDGWFAIHDDHYTTGAQTSAQLSNVRFEIDDLRIQII